jgi:hypothetical protein
MLLYPYVVFISQLSPLADDVLLDEFIELFVMTFMDVLDKDVSKVLFFGHPLFN